MISNILFSLDSVWKRIRVNEKLIFLVVILFLFPLLFIVVLERFFEISSITVQSTEEEKISAIHGTLAASLAANEYIESETLQAIAESDADLTQLKIYRSVTESSDEVEIISSMYLDEVSATSSASAFLHVARLTPGDTAIIPLQGAAGRVFQSVRLVPINGIDYFVFAEHNQSSFDSLLLQRKTDAYLLLSFIFGFLILLAYWVNRQIDWETKHSQLQRILNERDLFSNMIAHEFRTPLTAIKGYASFLQDSSTLTADESRYADTIRESAERLVLLVNDFLEIARIQSGKMKLKLASHDIRTIITRVTKDLRTQATDKGIQLVYTPGLKPQMLVTDENRLIQVLTNIISNSVKYTEVGTVEITCEGSRKEMTIRIKDTGMGISAEDQEKLFAPFARVGGVEKTATTGTGLGMWITQQLVEMLGGSIAVESIKEVGTHVVIKINKNR